MGETRQKEPGGQKAKKGVEGRAERRKKQRVEGETL